MERLGAIQALMQEAGTFLKTWDERAEKCSVGEKFRLPTSGTTLFVIHTETSDLQEHNASVVGFEKVATSLCAIEPDSTVVLLPRGWQFRVVKYGA